MFKTMPALAQYTALKYIHTILYCKQICHFYIITINKIYIIDKKKYFGYYKNVQTKFKFYQTELKLELQISRLSLSNQCDRCCQQNS